MLKEETYVEQAEKVILLQKNNRGGTYLTTSKIRNILEMTAEIYNEISRTTGEEIPEAIKEKLQYLRIKIVYEAGREKSVKKFAEDAKLVENIKEIYAAGNKEDLIRFCKYMEALVAYYKYTFGDK